MTLYLAGLFTIPAAALVMFWALCLWDSDVRRRHIVIVRHLLPQPRQMFRLMGKNRDLLAYVCRRFDFAILVRLPFSVPK